MKASKSKRDKSKILVVVIFDHLLSIFSYYECRSDLIRFD